MRTSVLFACSLAALSAACSGSLYRPSGVPRLVTTRFAALGDSITYGILTECPVRASTMTLSQLMFALPATASEPWSYPSVLQVAMSDRYSTQNPYVANRGVSNERISEGAARLDTVLLEEQANVLFLLEGTNDVNQGATPAQIGSVLSSMIRAARFRGTQTFVGTLLPQRPLGVGGSCRGFGAAAVDAANAQIRATTAAEGAVLVDVFAAFGGTAAPALIGPDGLHPTTEGYRTIADAFFSAVRSRLEQ